MATSYPTSLDTFTNPTSSDNLDSPDHAGQHSDVNDAAEALEAKLGTGNSPAASATDGQVLTADGTGGSAWETPPFRFDDAPVDIPADDFETFVGGGSPTFTNSGKGYHYWSMDSASTESVAATRFLPDSWSAFDVELWWVNDSSGSGDAAWRLSWMFAGDGESTGASGTLTPESIVTDTAGGEDGMVVVSIASGLTATSGKMLLVRVGREGGNVGDTLGNDAGVVHVRLKKAS